MPDGSDQCPIMFSPFFSHIKERQLATTSVQTEIPTTIERIAMTFGIDRLSMVLRGWIVIFYVED